MRISDWSSDVCSSDLAAAGATRLRLGARRGPGAVARIAAARDIDRDVGRLAVERLFEADLHIVAQIGAAACLRAAARTGAAHELAANILEIVDECAEHGVTGLAHAAPDTCTARMNATVISRCVLWLF